MKKICVITATRAEYGLLSSVIRELYNDKGLQLILIATGMHLDVDYGETYKEIEADGFEIDYKIQINEQNDEIGILNTIANAITKIGDVLVMERPDAIILLGDRYELLGFAVAALMLKIPIAHISGGEITEGAIDEYIRHAVTKMSTLHFVSTEEYRRRVIQMGEQPERVFNVGDLGVSNVKRVKRLSKKEIEQKIGMNIGDKLIQVTFHPETLSEDSLNTFDTLLEVLEEKKELQVVFTKANADLGGSKINKRIDEFVDRNAERARAFYSLGYVAFLSLLSQSIGIIGNSSSGIVEAPSLKIGTVNIGNRQKGRTRAGSVIDCDGSKSKIEKALEEIQDENYKKMLMNLTNPYESDDTAEKIVWNIKEFLNSNTTFDKHFFDLKNT